MKVLHPVGGGARDRRLVTTWVVVLPGDLLAGGVSVRRARPGRARVREAAKSAPVLPICYLRHNYNFYSAYCAG